MTRIGSRAARLPIVDSQVHVWKAETAERPWPKEARAFVHRPQFDADELRREMDIAGVAAAVVIAPSFTGLGNVDVVAAAEADPARLAVMAIVSLDEHASRPAVEGLRTTPVAKGLRLSFATEAGRTSLLEGSASWIWPLAERLDIPLMVNAPDLLPHIRRVAIRHPSLRIAIDHLGLMSPDERLTALQRVQPILQLADVPSIAVKASALPLQSGQPYPHSDIHEAIRAVIDGFGPDRVFWGSDLTRLRSPYRQVVSLFTEELGLDAATKELTMGRALAQWLDWPQLASLWPTTADVDKGGAPR